jgi:hypothetical protein
MLSRIKAGKAVGILAGAGLLVGLGVIGWIRLHTSDEPVANSQGGSVLLDTSATPTPTPDPLALRVAGANASSVQGTNPTGGSIGTTQATPAPAGAPGTADFKQYDKYRSETTALFGELTPGQGQEVAAGSVVSVAYRGYLTDGTLFDESYSSGKAFSFTEGEHQVILGWEEGLMGMKVGGKRRLIVPPSAGYGAQAHGPIPAGAVMVFDVELLGVK